MKEYRTKAIQTFQGIEQYTEYRIFKEIQDTIFYINHVIVPLEEIQENYIGELLEFHREVILLFHACPPQIHSNPDHHRLTHVVQQELKTPARSFGMPSGLSVQPGASWNMPEISMLRSLSISAFRMYSPYLNSSRLELTPPHVRRSRTCGKPAQAIRC